MARTTSTLVAGITEVDASIDVTPFIETAAELVTEMCAPLGYSSTRLELIERWLAAHFYRLRDQAVSSEGVGGLSVSYQYKIGMMLSQTKEGQQALTLDTKGGLAALSKSAEAGTKQKIGAAWLGTATT